MGMIASGENRFDHGKQVQGRYNQALPGPEGIIRIGSHIRFWRARILSVLENFFGSASMTRPRLKRSIRLLLLVRD